MDMETDMYMDLMENSLITDMSELEQNVEYYIVFYGVNMMRCNGIYTLVNIYTNNKNGEVCRLINTDNNNITFEMYYTKNVLSTMNNLNLKQVGIFSVNAFNTCNVFKMPTNEYVLK
jgi:hypothetical protein